MTNQGAARSSESEKILTLHPQGKKGTNISRRKYDTIRRHILSLLDDSELTYTQLVKGLHNNLQGAFDGSVSWYAVTVKLDLEARKVIVRTGSRPHKYRLAGN